MHENKLKNLYVYFWRWAAFKVFDQHRSESGRGGYLERVRTASNVAVQLVWDVRPDLPEGTRTARQLLLKDPGRVNETDREALHAYFRARIEEAKSSDTAASWEEQPGEALDYTAWHRFTVRLDVLSRDVGDRRHAVSGP
ncbi:hypothetical protein [Streptomyces sp. NPDC088801]|uniref:hypothetical protein n=1 Tax=Streptomyces sp. NPDC088801 TaxID=3365903 RepID=UPI0038224E24